ncbi:hypothetical protein BJY04DRAFT_232792 [Aspergillus karnatakaensis]|uniref:flavin-containing monooxygenase n=1 Tax=Aspergillus karnatakaensis TaxID=1810916 RepID=UPI003CCE5093
MADEYPPLAALPQLTLHKSIVPENIDAARIANDWLSSLAESLSQGQLSDIRRHFLDNESWVRDFVTFSWDIACHNGADTISNYLNSSTAEFTDPVADQPGALQPHLADMGGLRFVLSGFSFKTKFGLGRGVLRLTNVGADEWKAWTVFTVLESLHEQPDSNGSKVKARASSSATIPSKPQENEKPQVLIVGAGQSGLALAAHLQHLGLTYLVVDKASIPGAAWTERYTTIKSHTPAYTDHFPFLKFPSNWPRYLDQEHILSWMKHYTQILGLNVQYDSLVQRVEYDDTSKEWTVEIHGKEGVQIFSPKHVVLATGLLSDIPLRPTFTGETDFKGEIYHSRDHRSAAVIPDLQSKNVTIIGAGTTAHDLAVDFVNHGAKSVTMVQRHAIFVGTLETNEEIMLKAWNTPGLSTEDADLLGNSLPLAVVRTLSIGGSQMMSARDKGLLDGLERAGMAVKRGDGGDSLVDHQLIKAGRFYLEQGACEMILDGRIQVRMCEDGVRGFESDGVVLADGTKIDSDIVVLATGFERMDKAVARLMGKVFMERVGDIGQLDDSQERIGVWRPTGAPGFWFMTGSFIWSRQFAPVLALQIAAAERGLNGEYAS